MGGWEAGLCSPPHCAQERPPRGQANPSASHAEGERPALKAGLGEARPRPPDVCLMAPPLSALGCWAAPALSSAVLAPPCGRTEELDPETAIPIPSPAPPAARLLPAVEMVHLQELLRWLAGSSAGEGSVGCRPQVWLGTSLWPLISREVWFSPLAPRVEQLLALGATPALQAFHQP